MIKTREKSNFLIHGLPERERAGPENGQQAIIPNISATKIEHGL